MYYEERIRPGKKLKQLLYQAQSGKCMYCGIELDIRYFHVDHKTPWIDEGGDNIGNLQLLCAPCNGRKSDMTDGEFRRLYKLTPSRQAKGRPPQKQIPQSYFDARKKAIAKRRRAMEW